MDLQMQPTCARVTEPRRRAQHSQKHHGYHLETIPETTEEYQNDHSARRQSNVSAADSGVGLMAPPAPPARVEGKLLYGDLRRHLERERRRWIIARDVELAAPLQQIFLAYEAGVMQDMHEAERRREAEHREQAREVEAAAAAGAASGAAMLSWGLYRLRVKACGILRRRCLRGAWKRGRLSAMRKELGEQYVREQVRRRQAITRALIWVAGEEVVDGGDDGAYVRDSMLNYIITGYDSLFPLRRELEVDVFPV